MTGQIVELTHYVGECENSAEVYIRPHPKTPLSAALAHVVTMLGLYEDEYGFADAATEQVEFDDFVAAFGQYANGIQDRGENSLCIKLHTILNAEQQAAIEVATSLLKSITVINSDEMLSYLFNYIKNCMDNECDVDSHDILKCNQPLSKAILIMRDLIREGHEHWGDEVEDLFLAQF